jgi:tetratricopeptide (TPR) repeat protein
MDYKDYKKQAEEAFNRGDYAEAIRLYTLAIEARLKEGEEGYDKEVLAILYYNRGVCYNELKDFDKALADYSIAIKLNLKLAEAYNNRGNVYSKQKAYDKALADFSKAIELNPNFAEAYYNRGNVYHNRKDYDKALVDYTKAIELNKEYAEPYNNRGVVYKELKDFDKALADYNKAIELNPKLAEAYSNRGSVYYQLKEYEKALADYNKAIALNPNNEIYYYNRFALYKKRKEYENALKDFEKIKKLIHLDPKLDNLFTEVVEIEREKRKDELDKLETQKQGFVQDKKRLDFFQNVYLLIVFFTVLVFGFMFYTLYAHHSELFDLYKSGQPYYELIAWKLTFIPFGVWLCYLLLAYIVKPLVSSLFTWSEKQKDLGYMQTLVDAMDQKTADAITESFAEEFEEKKKAQDTLITMTVARYHQFFNRSAMQMPEQKQNTDLLREIRLMIESILKNK